jgi:nitrogen fixation-related uncharacterized protein
MTAIIPYWWQFLKSLTLSEFASSFAFRFPAAPDWGLFFALIGLLSYLILWWAMKVGQKRDPDRTEKIKSRAWFRFYYYSYPSLFILNGILFAIGMPISIPLGVVVCWTYLALWAEEARYRDNLAPVAS